MLETKNGPRARFLFLAFYRRSILTLVAKQSSLLINWSLLGLFEKFSSCKSDLSHPLHANSYDFRQYAI